MSSENASERIVTGVPGPRSRALAARLADVEAPGVTFLAEDYPVFWESAEGALVTDVDGNRYLDLTSAFGVASTGHTNPAVRDAIVRQAGSLIHGMGDVHPTEVRTRLLEALAEIAPGDLGRTYLSGGGAEAVEFALKTALLATGKPRVLAYHGAYHGLTLGALEVIGIDKFRAPFEPLVAQRATFLPYPREHDDAGAAIAAARTVLERDDAIGAVLIEPIQGRGGVIVPPAGFLRALRALCSERGVLLILDEIFTGFGRTGTMFACEHEGVVPDLLCVGKALGGGVPIAATIGSARAMRGWAPSTGEALHTATFIGNPLTCAAALANLDELRAPETLARVAARGAQLAARLAALPAGSVRAVRGRGLLHAIELGDARLASAVVVRALALGLVLLQSGPLGTSITLAPPFAIGERQLDRACDLLEQALRAAERTA